MKLRALVAAAALTLASGAAFAYVSGAIKITSLAVSGYSLNVNTTGPQSAILPLNGGTFTCSGGTATVTNSNVDSGSIIWTTLKTVGGTVAQPFVATITAGTGFTVTCGGSDTSVYNYVIVG